MKLRTLLVVFAILVVIVVVFQLARRPEKAQRRSLNFLPARCLCSGSRTSSANQQFPTAEALSPDGHYLAILNNGYGTEESGFQQSIAILDLTSHKVTDFPDARLGQRAGQTYYLGLAFSQDGGRLYASMASLTDPTGRSPTTPAMASRFTNSRTENSRPKGSSKFLLLLWPAAKNQCDGLEGTAQRHGDSLSGGAGGASWDG